MQLCDVCDGINAATGLLGVAAKHIRFNNVPIAATGLNLIGLGTESTAKPVRPGQRRQRPAAGDRPANDARRGARLP